MRRIVAGAVLALVLSGLSAPPSHARAHIQIRGTDNVATAIDWSQFRFNDDTGSTAVLGRADQFADALAAGALAGFVSAPFLVTATGDLDDRVKTELERLGTDLVRIVGGTAAISQAVEDELVALGYD